MGILQPQIGENSVIKTDLKTLALSNIVNKGFPLNSSGLRVYGVNNYPEKCAVHLVLDVDNYGFIYETLNVNAAEVFKICEETSRRSRETINPSERRRLRAEAKEIRDGLIEEYKNRFIEEMHTRGISVITLTNIEIGTCSYNSYGKLVIEIPFAELYGNLETSPPTGTNPPPLLEHSQGSWAAAQ